MLMRIILSLALCIMLVGCKTTTKIVEVPIEKVVTKTDSIYITKVKVDSVIEKDSIYINTYVKGDTIYRDNYRFISRWRDRVKLDTIYKTRTDTIKVEKAITIEVEKPLSWWQKVKQDVGGIAMGILVTLLVGLIIWVLIKTGTPKNA